MITSKARKELGFIYYRKVSSLILTRLYTTLIHPCLEYCCAVWDPHLPKDIDKLKSAQRLACKICIKIWSASHDDHLHILNLPITHVRRTFLKLCIMYKILRNTFSFPENIVKLRSKFQTRAMSTHYVSTLTLHSVCSHYLFHKLIRILQLHGMASTLLLCTSWFTFNSCFFHTYCMQ